MALPKTIYPFLALLLMAGPLEARMYQWVNPASGHTQFSGKPPAWYRSKAGGPRVFVFENGRLVDDTDREVSEVERQTLRTQAFSLADSHKKPTAGKAFGSNPPEAAPVKPLSAGAQEGAMAEQKAAAKDEKEGIQTPAQEIPPEADTIERLKRIIADWDKHKEEEAKRLLETLSDPGSPAPPSLPAR